jgi:hypothetical protein
MLMNSVFDFCFDHSKTLVMILQKLKGWPWPYLVSSSIFDITFCLLQEYITQVWKFHNRNYRWNRTLTDHLWPKKDVKYFVRFLGNGVSRKNAFEIYWPLRPVHVFTKQFQQPNLSLVLSWLDIFKDKIYWYFLWLKKIYFNENMVNQF